MVKKLSIAMATYNGAPYLKEQLESFIWQSRLPDELIVCDDGSDDGTLDILKSFAITAPFEVCIFVNETNLGFTQNFAKAMSHCNGDLIFLSDQDDVWFVNKIEYVLSLFDQSPNAWVIVHDGRIVDEQLSWSGVTKLQQTRSGYGTKESLVTGALTAFRKELLEFVLPIPPGIVGHDAWLHSLSRFFEGRRIVSEECLQAIRRHSDNTSEWVVNSQNRIGRLDVFYSQLRTVPASVYQDRVNINTALLKRLTSLAKVMCVPSDISTTLVEVNRLKSELVALENRQQLADAGTLARRYLAISMLFRGDYRYFNGIRSFLRDVFR